MRLDLTLHLDGIEHESLRQLAQFYGKTCEEVVQDALDAYLAGTHIRGVKTPDGGLHLEERLPYGWGVVGGFGGHTGSYRSE